MEREMQKLSFNKRDGGMFLMKGRGEETAETEIDVLEGTQKLLIA